MSQRLRLHLPRLTRAAVRSQNLLANPPRFAFTLGDQQGELRLLPGEALSATTFSHWRCALGDFSLADATPLLNLLSLSPVDARLPVGEETAWQMILFNQYLSPELARLFGNLTLCDDQETPALPVRLQVRLGDRQAECLLRLRHDALVRWLAQPGWTRPVRTLPDGLLYSQPLVLGRLTLNTSQLPSLRAGDVLVPPVCYFTPGGQGSVVLAGQQWSGELTPPHRFLLTHMESIALEPYAEDEFDDLSRPETLAAEETMPLAALRLSLEVRCGRTQLTLGELQQLQAGSVLTLTGVTPGEAGLYHGERLIAEGELVDVDGQLGLQLTRLLLTTQQEEA